MLAVVLLLAGLAYLLARAPWNPAMNPEGRLSEDDLWLALEDFGRLAGGSASEEKWGYEGTGKNGTYGSFEIRSLQDPANRAFEISLALVVATESLEYSRKQSGEVLNVHFNGTTYLGRDEDPTTLSESPTSVSRPEDRLDFETLEVDRSEPATIEGKVATKFYGYNETAAFEFWVWNDSKKLARIRMVEGDDEFDLRLLYGDDVQIVVDGSLPDRMAVTMQKEETHTAAQGWYYVNGSLTQNQTEEVSLADLEMRAVAGTDDPATVNASMRLDRGAQAQGDYAFTFADADGDGLLSAGDSYTFRYPSSDEAMNLRFYDSWANQYVGALAGFQATALLASLALGLVMVRRQRT